MALDWFFFALLTGFIYGGVELFDKFVLNQEVSRASISAIVAKVPNFLIFAAVGIIQTEIIFSLTNFILGFILASLYIVSSYFYYEGISQEDVSRFIPTLSVNSVFIVILSFLFLGESFGVSEYVGMFLTIAGAILISVEKPQRGIHIFQSRKAVLMGIIAALLWAVRDIFLKIGTSSVDIFLLLFWIGVNGIFLTLLSSVFAYHRMEDSEMRGYEHLLIIGSLTAMGYLTFIKSLSLGPVSLASVIVKIDSAIVFVGSIIISKLHPGIIREKLDRDVLIQKALALLMIIAGVILIQLF
ncbi:MAG: EamA family transporter [Candidatus Nanohaloarchaea archaeon]